MLRDIQHLKAERVMKKSEENNKGDGANDKKSSTGKKEDWIKYLFSLIDCMIQLRHYYAIF